MKKTRESGSECTNENNTHGMETLQNVSVDNSNAEKKAVLIQLNFQNRSNNFNKTIEIVCDVKALREEIDEIVNIECEAISYNENQFSYGEYYLNDALSYAKFFLLSPFRDYTSKCKYFTKLVAGFGIFQNYFSEHPEANFKAIFNIDISFEEHFYADLNFVAKNKLTKDDKSKLNILKDKDISIEMTLKSKIEFFNDEEIEFLKQCLTIISNGNYISCAEEGSSNSYFENLFTHKKLNSLTDKLFVFRMTKSTVYDPNGELIIPVFFDYEIFKYFDLPIHNIPTGHS